MSHIVTIMVEVRDLDAIRSACRRLQLKEPVHGRATLFETEVEGVIVELPEWIFPVVCDLSSGELKYDNFGGAWGEQKHLDRFVQTYCIEKATLEARRKGYSVMEQELADGSVKLTIKDPETKGMKYPAIWRGPSNNPQFRSYYSPNLALNEWRRRRRVGADIIMRPTADMKTLLHEGGHHRDQKTRPFLSWMKNWKIPAPRSSLPINARMSAEDQAGDHMHRINQYVSPQYQVPQDEITDYRDWTLRGYNRRYPQNTYVRNLVNQNPNMIDGRRRYLSLNQNGPRGHLKALGLRAIQRLLWTR